MTGRPVPAIVPEAVLRRPTPEAAIAIYEPWRIANGLPRALDASLEVTALCCIHKARLMWRGSSKAMVRESKAWLVAHGFRPGRGLAGIDGVPS